MIEQITQDGFFIADCSVPGETRADGAYPHMADALQLSKDRWLILYSTRGFLGVDQGFRGGDNDRSVVYQIRKDDPAGPVLKENILARYREDWDALGDGGRYLKQHASVCGFGVPKGALVHGRRVPHENLFAATWYCCPRARGTGLDDLPSGEFEEKLFGKAFCIEWTQFKLNDTGTDIEILQPPRMMRQKGYESGDLFCSVEPRCAMNKWYVKPAPFTDDHSEWVQLPHFTRGIAAIRFKVSPATRLYEWVQTGPLFDTGYQSGLRPSNRIAYRLTETSVLRHTDSWIIAARSAEPGSKNVPGTAWFRTDDLFKPLPKPFFPGSPKSNAPTGVFRCPDGVVRIFTGDRTASPYGNERDPLYCWDVDLDDGFKVATCRVVFDATKAGMPVREESGTRVDMPNLFPHAGGKEQWLVYRARVRRRKHPTTRLVEEEKRRSGLYCGRLVFDSELPPAWQFE